MEDSMNRMLVVAKNAAAKVLLTHNPQIFTYTFD